MSTERQLEQRYFDTAAAERERMRVALTMAPAAAAHSGAAVRIRREVQGLIEQIGTPDDPVAFGRMDTEAGEVLYVGHHGIRDDQRNVLVVGWKAPAAAAFYEANHADPRGLRLKRTFTCERNTIVDLSDLIFAELASSVAKLTAGDALDDALLTDLERDRTGEMQDIVRTIQAAQFDLIRAPLEQLMVIQGGPGTGKTAVALHRVSWLLYNSRDRLEAADVLIVGPTAAFTRYTRTVLPSLGDISVAQRAIGHLHPPVKQGREEAPETTRLKGDARMAGLLRRALYARVGPPSSDRPLQVRIAGQVLVLTDADLRRVIAAARSSMGTFAEHRKIFRDLLADHAADLLLLSQKQARPATDPMVERIWPTFTPMALLRDLFGSRERLMAAAGDEFTAREIGALHRRSAERISDESWSDADLPLLDELEFLINGIDDQFAHVVVDEAQDLSPMQLRSVAHRSATGSMTVVGDIAQSTGAWARDDWDDVLTHLPSDLPQEVYELRYGYRVPKQIFDLAARLLALAAPGVTAPEIVRNGPSEPVLLSVDAVQRAGSAVQAATVHAGKGRSVGIVCPARCREDLEDELRRQEVQWHSAARGDLGRGINVVTPHEAKGLEFDTVVVIEPEEIIKEDERGHRLLYVALTRSTRYLHIIATGPHLPLPGEVAPERPAAAPEGLTAASERPPAAALLPAQTRGAVHEPVGTRPSVRRPATQTIIDSLAGDLAEEMRSHLAPALWPAVLDRMRELLELERS
ncbi:HelD family protein [Catenuloplanes japonicus]|uniref:HelD family protein n=1 Tax=Catenuloplanes japonicus TaxID=33876 RepID=UPI000526D1B7|nr:UvrD-helicase domain-containing protein [Catenuloplanes japonicus]